VDHGQRIGNDRDRAGAPRHEQLLAVGLANSTRPGPVPLPHGGARHAGQQERAPGRDFDLDPGTVVRTLREIHPLIVGAPGPNMKDTGPIPEQGTRGNPRFRILRLPPTTSTAPQPPLHADVSHDASGSRIAIAAGGVVARLAKV